jgi:hypothetical protein
MIDRKLARMALRLWNVSDVPLSQNKHNRRQWLRSVQLLGKKWRVLDKQERVDKVIKR